MNTDAKEQDCAICLQKYHHPAQLPCGHVFCFLCVKGIAIQSKKCAMCRTQIPIDYFDHPKLLEELALEETDADNSEGKYQWYYEGRNGWWKYDERSNNDLESSYNSGETECLLLLAGTIYCVDFQNMIQIRRSDHTKRRKVKRDVPTLPSKGVAGIKNIESEETQQSHLTDNVNSNNNESAENPNETAAIIDDVLNSDNDNVIAQIVSPIVHSIDDLTHNIRQINLDEHLVNETDDPNDESLPVTQDT